MSNNKTFSGKGTQGLEHVSHPRVIFAYTPARTCVTLYKRMLTKIFKKIFISTPFSIPLSYYDII